MCQKQIQKQTKVTEEIDFFGSYLPQHGYVKNESHVHYIYHDLIAFMSLFHSPSHTRGY